VKEHDIILIKHFNERIKPEDTLFFLGDFCFSHSSEASEAPKKAFDYYREQINCKNIIFIKGNHDANNQVKSIIQHIVIYYGGQLIKLTHDPKHAELKYKLNLCGHVHEKWSFGTIIKEPIGIVSYICNVGVDVNNFYPVTYGEIISNLSKWRQKNGIKKF
jgi:calcineurin-like phosphoesterase family protein